MLIKHAKKGNYEDVAKLIDPEFSGDLCASVNYQEPATGFTALHYAAKNGDTILANLLLSNFTDAKLQDAKGQNPMHIACARGDLEMYKLLIQHGWNECKLSLDTSGKTPLDLAYENKHTIIVQQDRKFTIMLYSDK